MKAKSNMTPAEWLEYYATTPVPKSIQIEEAIKNLKRIGILDESGKVREELKDVFVPSRQEQPS